MKSKPGAAALVCRDGKRLGESPVAYRHHPPLETFEPGGGAWRVNDYDKVIADIPGTAADAYDLVHADRHLAP